MKQLNNNKIYFAADKFGRISIFDEKPNIMIDMEKQDMFGYPQNLPYWVVEKNEIGPFGRSVTRSDFGIPFSQELFYKLFNKNLTFEESPFKVEF